MTAGALPWNPKGTHSALWSSRRQQVLSLVTGSSSLITAALLCSVTEFHPRENWFISLNYTLKQALSKSIKLIEKCPYHPIARFVFGPCVVDFSLMSSQAETALILLIEGLFRWTVFVSSWSVIQELLEVDKTILAYLPAICLPVKIYWRFFRFPCNSSLKD